MKEVELPSGEILEFPDKMNWDEVRFVVQRETQLTPPIPPVTSPPVESSMLDQFAMGVGDMAHGISQIAGQDRLQPTFYGGIPGPEQILGQRPRTIEEERSVMPDPQGLGQNIARIVGQTVAAPVALGRGPSLLGNMLRGGAEASLTAGLEYADTPEQRMQRIQTGGLLGSGMTGALGAGQKFFSDPNASPLADIAQAQNVPLYQADVTANPLTKRAAQTAEVLFGSGMVPARVRQGAAAKTAAQRIVDRYTKADDIGEELQQSLARSLDAGKEAYRGKVAEVNMQIGDEIVPTKNLRETAERIFYDEASNPEAYQRSDILNLMDRYSQDPEANFARLDSMRSDLLGEVSDFYKGNSAIGSKGVHLRQQLVDAITEDMESAARRSGGEAWERYREAKDIWRSRVVPFTKRLGKAINTDEPDRILSEWIKSGHKNRAKNFYRALDKEGRLVAKRGMLQDMMEKSVNVAGDEEIFSPNRFAAQIERMEAPIKGFFSPSERRELAGFAKLMRAIGRAGQVMENPPTGQQATPYLATAAASLPAVFAPSTIGAVAVGAGSALTTGRTITALFGTETGRKLLSRSARLRPNSQAWADILDQTESIVARASGVAPEPQTEPQ